jgi:trans-2,3-dihydro-3-hydroxyanthranilate isomerase
VLLARKRLGGSPTSDDGEADAVLVLAEDVGAVRCGVRIRNGFGHAIFDAPLLPTVTGEPADRDTVAAALGLLPAEIGFENHRPSAFTAGMPFTFVPVRDLAAIRRVAPATPLWNGAFGQAHDANVYVYTRECVAAGRSFHARMFAPNIGLDEDPATGAAVAAFAGVISRFDGMPAGSHRFTIEQGFEIERPSLIDLEIDVADGRIVASRIGGDAVIVGEGTLEV